MVGIKNGASHYCYMERNGSLEVWAPSQIKHRFGNYIINKEEED